MSQVMQLVRYGINTVVTDARGTSDKKRPRNNLQHVTWSVVGELLNMCSRIRSESLGVAVSDNMLSTAWNPAYLRETRPTNPKYLVAKG